MNDLDNLLDSLRKFDALRDADTVLTRVIPNHPPSATPDGYPNTFPPALCHALASQGINHLYVHQTEAINRIMTGNDVVLDAPTASSKTLCFNIPIILNFLDDPQSNALIVHPMKALSNDQRHRFDELARSLSEIRGRRLESWIFDGDTSAEARKLLKYKPPSVLFTNPEMLHQSFLGWQEQWLTFLSRLKLVILDEIHEYRGYFGTNIALLLRRFFAKLAQLNVRPQVVLATATCQNAEEHVYRLTGRHCVLVRATTNIRPESHFAFINLNIPDFRFREIYKLRIARATLACFASNLSTLIFCPSRRFAEKAAMQAKQDARDFGIDPNEIAPYRSGYESELRREIEDGLRSGRLKAVFSTNALEIGVDIRKLDICILAGFPDSAFSAWQRIGRVGRSWDKKAYIRSAHSTTHSIGSSQATRKPSFTNHSTRS